MKKLTLSLAVLFTGVVVNSYAALPTGSSKFDVKVPCYRGGLTFGLAGLYLKPSTSELDYALAFPAEDDTTDGKYHSVDSKYDWGYKISLGYLFPCSGNDITLSYTSFNKGSKENLESPAIHGSITPFAPISDDGVTFVSTSSEAKAKYNYQAVDLDAGQHFSIGCNTNLRAFAGLRYVDLESRFDANYFGDVDFDADADVDHVGIFTAQKSRFKGIGPRLGMDLNYAIGNGFGVVGQVASALIIGNINSNYNAIASVIDAAGNTTVEGLSYKFPEETRVVPNLTSKLGLDYSYQFCNPSRTKLTIEAGYLADYYFNSLDRLNTLGGILPENRTRHTIDTSFNGPYVGIQVNL